MPTRYYGVQNEVKAYCNRLQNETSIVVTPSVLKTLNDRVESLKRAGTWSQFGLGFNDNDGDAYLSRASVTDVIGRAEVLWFTRGIKSLGLWNQMVSWPLRSYQNIGTGSTVRSLGGRGTFDGNMVNGPSWGLSGMAFNAATVSRIETTYPHNPYRPQIYCMVVRRGGVNGATYGLIGSGVSGNMNQLRRDSVNRWRADSVGASGTVIYTQNNSGGGAESNNALTYVSLHGVSNAFTGTVNGVTWTGPSNAAAGTPGASNLSIGVAGANSVPWPSDIVFFSVFESSDFNIANNVRNLTKQILVSDLQLP